MLVYFLENIYFTKVLKYLVKKFELKKQAFFELIQ